MNVATIDLGSNSFLLAIFEMEEGKIIKELYDECVITRLSEGVDKSKVLSPAALERAKECLTNFKKTIDKFNVQKTTAVSTSAARDAKNKEEFLQIGKDLNIPIQIIPGLKEAELTFKGSAFEQENPEEFCVIDIGGGSTEIITQSENKISSFSFDIGSVRLTEKFITSFPTSDDEIKNVENFIIENFNQKKELFEEIKSKKIIAVAGTPTTLMQMIGEIEFDVGKIHNQRISQKYIKDWRDKLQKMSLEERCRVKGLPEKRADVIVSGLSILYNFLKYINQDELVVSTKGVRYGLAFEA